MMKIFFFLFIEITLTCPFISYSHFRSYLNKSRQTAIFSQPILKSYYECRNDWYVNGTKSIIEVKALKSRVEAINDCHNNNSHRSNISFSLPNYLFANANTYFDSMTAIKQNIRKGLILVNGVKANNQYILKPNDYIQHVVRSHVDTSYSSTNSSHSNDIFVSNQPITTHSYGESLNITEPVDEMECRVLWEDEYLAIVLKPQGLPMFNQGVNNNSNNNNGTAHKRRSIKVDLINNNDADDDDDHDGSVNVSSSSSSSSSVHASILTALLRSSYRLPPTFSTSTQAVDYQPLRRPRLVHRLDQGTGGLVVVAKTHPALSALSHCFASRQIHKTYRAMVVGSMHRSDLYTNDSVVVNEGIHDMSGVNGDHKIDDDDDDDLNASVHHQNVSTMTTTTAITSSLKLDTGMMSGQITMPIDGKAAITDWHVVRQDTYSSSFNEFSNTTFNHDNNNNNNNDDDDDNNNDDDDTEVIAPLSLKRIETNNHRNRHHIIATTTSTITTNTTAAEAEPETVITTLELHPHTGRKHQIRRHLDSIGHPIIGDPDYWFSHGRRQSAQRAALRHALQQTPYPALQKINPICLFATGLSFTHPFKVNTIVNVSIPEPISFITLRNQLKLL